MNKIGYYKERFYYELVRLKSFYQKKKYFIHIPKCAGMSIRRSTDLAGSISPINKNMLINKDYYNNLNNFMKSINDHHGLEHARVRDIKKSFLNKYSFFSIIRNPWERVASRYFFAKQVIEIEKKYHENKHKIASFEEFLDERHIWGNKEFMWHRAIRGWYNCYDYVVDEDKKIIPDILRFEELNTELKLYFKLENVHKKRNVTKKKIETKLIYNQKTIQIVADWYKKDIDFFGYDFDSTATRNVYYT